MIIQSLVCLHHSYKSMEEWRIYHVIFFMSISFGRSNLIALLAARNNSSFIFFLMRITKKYQRLFLTKHLEMQIF